MSKKNKKQEQDGEVRPFDALVMRNLMVDIETMGNGSNSAIVSIGALEFDLTTGKTGKEFYRNIDLESCLDLGLSVNGSTIKWWLGRNKEARKEIQKEGVSISKGLIDFADFCLDGEYKLWGNSARFDLGILGDAFKKANIEIPWNFRDERDVRTLVAFKPEIKENFKFNGTKHNALDDCYNQVGYCSKIWSVLNCA